jgi:hypothetical protein
MIKINNSALIPPSFTVDDSAVLPATCPLHNRNMKACQESKSSSEEEASERKKRKTGITLIKQTLIKSIEVSVGIQWVYDNHGDSP